MGGVGRGVARTFVMCRPYVSLRRIAPKGGTCRCRMGSHPLSGGGAGPGATLEKFLKNKDLYLRFL